MPPKVKTFTWKASHGILPTKNNLAKKGVVMELACVTCSEGLETKGHVFWECSFTRALWFVSPFRVRFGIRSRPVYAGVDDVISGAA